MEDAAGSSADAGDGLGGVRLVDYCGVLANSAWPRTPVARRALLHRFEILRPQCMTHAPFLAVLGALWLEEGEPAQAMVWLERSLMLQPEQLGAQADHALALAALGETAARDALAQQWAHRADVPPALLQRLNQRPVAKSSDQPGGGGQSATPANTVDGWVFYSEASALSGYESNLSYSPRLNELTLTPPNEPPVTLSVSSRPRRGAALVTEQSGQLAYSPRQGMIVQAGVQGSIRHAPSESSTDWHHIQVVGAVSQQWDLWRGGLQASVTQVGGALSEAYQLARFGVSVDREAIGCGIRLTIEGENRKHEQTASQDGRTVGALWSQQCPLPGNNWVWGFALRRSVDSPVDPSRPGGVQRQTSLGLRLAGALNGRYRLELGWRSGLVTDSAGYNVLIRDGAIRRLNQHQFSLELARSLQLSWMQGAEGLIQVTAARQLSNLPIFPYTGVSVYGGLRWRW
ncbi:hypothetical protein [Aquabacterium sp.]|uniref:hypothetical protein n=1 Tax=Aquabacterium sp. TaxID=1872578 RepID=UPI00378401E8